MKKLVLGVGALTIMAATPQTEQQEVCLELAHMGMYAGVAMMQVVDSLRGVPAALSNYTIDELDRWRETQEVMRDLRLAEWELCRDRGDYSRDCVEKTEQLDMPLGAIVYGGKMIEYIAERLEKHRCTG